jgi:exopolysaccharide biosynthesis polyprenyl glycosylphosphotransferase
MIRVFHHYFSGKKLLFFVAESLAIASACVLGAAVVAMVVARPDASVRLLPRALPKLAVLSLAFVGVFQFALYLLDLYDLRVATEDRTRGIRILKAAGFALALMGMATLVLPFRMPGGTLMGGAMGAVLGALITRAGMRTVLGDPSNVLIVGRGAPARAVAQAIEDQGEDAFRVCAMIDPLDSDRSKTGDWIQSMAQRLRVGYVVAACDDPGGTWAESLLRCRIAGYQVYDGARFCERVLRRIPVSCLRALDLAFTDELHISRLRRVVKRAFDLVMAAALVVIALPLMVLVALAIKLDSPGPVFYRQVRVGRNAKRYTLWKFRSMAADAEKDGAVWAKINDERVTRVGRFIRKTRIDEIPQVFNVLLGQMSFVGPRPERPVFVEQLKALIPFYGLREMVNPGITGWAQIRYPYGASVEDARNKLEFDLYYLKNGSLFLDLGIIFHTVRHVLRRRGAR